MTHIESLTGDCLALLPTLTGRQDIYTCVTSPPYFGLRDYGLPPTAWPAVSYSPLAGLPALDIPAMDVCLGLEPTPEAYIGHLVHVFRLVRDVLRDDGTLWVNMGDSYAANRTYQVTPTKWPALDFGDSNANTVPDGLKPKDLMMMPARLALALQADGWYLRSDIIWAKPNPMPESVTDRPTKAHEYLFLLSKSAHYYYDADAIREPAIYEGDTRYLRGDRSKESGGPREDGGSRERTGNPTAGRNKRTVWAIATKPYSGAKDLADYVLPDGTPCIASPNCPIHGHLADRQKWQKVSGDAPPVLSRYHIPDKSNRHAEERASAEFAKSDHNTIDARPAKMDCLPLQIPQRPTPGSTPAYRILGCHPGYRSLVQIPARSSRIHESHAHQDYKRGCPHLWYARIAMPHNNQSHKMGRAQWTNPPYMPFGKTADHIERMSALPLFSGHHLDTGDYNIFEDGLDDNPNKGNRSRNTHKLATQDSFEASDLPSWIDSRCSCVLCQIDHFAVFPPDLIEPCVLAGCPETICAVCGAAWERVTERTPMEIRRSDRGDQLGQYGKTAASGTMITPARVETTGWQPTCDCAADTQPGAVLDPFAGSGTTGAVAVQHRRRAVLIELNAEYVALQADRTTQQVRLF